MAAPSVRKENIAQLIILGKEERTILERLTAEQPIRRLPGRQNQRGRSMSATLRLLLRQEAARRGWPISRCDAA